MPKEIAEVSQNEETKEVVFEVDAEVKKEFLENQEESTRSYYTYVLGLADRFEAKIGKKIYDFDISERDELLIVQFKNKNTWAFQTALSPLKTYIDFCISPKNLVRHNENRFAAILPSNYKDYINVQAMENSYIPLSECREFQSQLVNDQDKLILELLSLGVRGRTVKGNTLEELVNLKVKDIKWKTKHLYLTKNNIGEQRYIEVDDYTLDLLKRVINQTFYLSNNGLKMKPNDDGIYEKTDRGRVINPTEYVFRVPGQNKHGKADYQLFASRIQRMQIWLKNEYLTVSNLYFSSILDYAKKLKEEKGELERLDYIRINQRFEFGLEKSDGKTLNNSGEKYIFKIKQLINQYLSSGE